MKNWEILIYIILLFLGWRISLLFVTFFGLSTFPNTHMLQNLFWPSSDLDYWVRWSNWDGGHFIGIAERGYLSFQTVFFPLYPLLIKFFMTLGIPTVWASLLISNVSTIIALFFLYKLVVRDFNNNVAKKTLFALLIFPTSFYLGSSYTEALFLATTTAAFYFARQKRWFLASILAGCASATRLIGLAVICAIFVEYLSRQRGKFSIRLLSKTFPRRLLVYTLGIIIILIILQRLFSYLKFWFGAGLLHTLLEYSPLVLLLCTIIIFLEFCFINLNFKRILNKNFFILFISFIPLITYIYYQYRLFRSPFSFLLNEQAWKRVFSFPWDPPIGVFNYLIMKNFFGIGNTARSLTEFIFFIFFLAGFAFSIYKFRFSYIFYYLLALILPLFSGTLIAIERYYLMIFPFFILLALIKNELIQKVGTILSLLLLSAYSILFINGFWVT